MSNKNLFAYPTVGRRPPTSGPLGPSVAEALIATAYLDYDSRYGMTRSGGIPSADGQVVERWFSHAAGGRYIDFNTGVAPIKKDNTFGSIPSVYNDGIRALIEGAGITDSYNDYTVFTVYRPVCEQDQYTRLFDVGGVGAPGGPTVLQNGFNQGQWTWPSIDTTTLVGPVVPQGMTLVSGMSRQGLFQKMGTNGLRTTFTSIGAFTGPTAPNYLFVMTAAGSNTGGYKGYLARMIFIKKFFTDAEYDAMETYLLNLYNGPVDKAIALLRTFSPNVLLVADRGMSQLAAAAVPYTPVDESDPVGRWLDLSGNNRHATQATVGNRPTLRKTIANGRAAVKFDATLNQVIFGSNAISGPCTYITVFRDDTGAGSVNPRVISGATSPGGDDGANNPAMYVSSNSTLRVAAFYNSGGSATNVAYVPGTFNTAFARFNTTQADSFLNGVAGTPGAITFAPTTTLYYVGGRGDFVASTFLNGYVALACIIPGAVSDANLAIIQTALKAAYGTP